MKSLPLAMLLAAAFLLPAIPAAPAGAQLTDTANDAPGPVDVTAAWFTAYSSSAVGEATVDCILYACKDGIRVHVELRDLLAAAPAADADPTSLRYYYRMEFTPDAWNSKVTVDCVINAADIGIGNVNQFGPETGLGTYCKATTADATTGDAFDVASNKIHWNDKSQWTTVADVMVDRTTNTLVVSLVEDLADISPGTTFSGLQVTTWISGNNVPGGPFRNLADTTGTGATYVY